MLQRIIGKIKEVFRRMRLTAYSDISELRELPVSDDFYKLIEMWKQIYMGEYKPWVQENVNTINGITRRDKDTLNMAKIASQELATLVFNERCEISTSNDELTDHIQKILDDNAFNTKFQNYLEYQFAMGGMVVKPFMNPKNKLQLSYVTADNFVPISWDNKNIYEAVFPKRTTKKNAVFTLLEWHLWEEETYVVRNELYRAEKDSGELGKRVPLDMLYPDIEEEVRIENLEYPLFVYFQPATANNVDTEIPLGVPIYSHILPTLKAINDIYNSYMREFRLGKRRIIVPTTAIQVVPDESRGGELRRFFDPDDEVYEAMDIGDMDNGKIQDNSVGLRVQEHIDALNSQLNVLSAACGFSAGTFTFEDGGVKTATEVVSENSKTFRTKQSHENIIEAQLKQLVHVIVQMADLYDIFPTPTEEFDVSVMFDDSIAEDKDSETNREILLVNEKMNTRVRALMKIHGITEEEAIKLKEEIDEESAVAMQENIDLFGRNGGAVVTDDQNKPPVQEEEDVIE